MNKKGLFLIGFFCLIFSVLCTSCPNNNNNIEQTAPDWAIGEWYTAETFDSDSWCAEVAKDYVDTATTIVGGEHEGEKYVIYYGKAKTKYNAYPAVASFITINTDNEFKVAHDAPYFPGGEAVAIHLKKSNSGVVSISIEGSDDGDKVVTTPVYKKPAGN